MLMLEARVQVDTLVLEKVEIGGKEAIRLHHISGEIVTEKEFFEIVDRVRRFYDSRNQEDIETSNLYIEFNNDISHNFPYLKRGYSYKIPEPIIRFKEFKPILKRKWSCKYALCGRRISSDKDNGYYLLDINKYIDLSDLDIGDWFGFRRSCSPKCAEVIWKDIFKQWIKHKNYERFFE